MSLLDRREFLAISATAALVSPRFAHGATEPPAPPPIPVPPPGPAPGPPPPTNAAITIQGNAYHPALLTVPPGTTIAFTNADNRRHSASFFSGAIVSTPIFTSGTQTVKMPATPGTYGFQCAVHGAAMSGTIIVQ